MQVKCNFCGDIFEKTKSQYKRSKKQFCSKKCRQDYDKSYRVSVECVNCKDMFDVPKWRYKRATKFFCNKTCKKAYELRSTIQCRCDLCGELTRKPIYRFSRYDLHFCDWKCKHAYDISSREDVNCSYCGKDIEIQGCRFKAYGKWFCDNDCKFPYYHNPEHEAIYYGKDWKTIRLKALNRDGFLCQICGSNKKDMLVVHHIIPVKEFDTLDQAHDLSNLVTVCRACHCKIEPRLE